jgi:hypothetical protein
MPGCVISRCRRPPRRDASSLKARHAGNSTRPRDVSAFGHELIRRFVRRALLTWRRRPNGGQLWREKIDAGGIRNRDLNREWKLQNG